MPSVCPGEGEEAEGDPCSRFGPGIHFGSKTGLDGVGVGVRVGVRVGAKEEVPRSHQEGRESGSPL